MVTFVEAPIFSKYVHDYLSDEEYADFQLYLAANPGSGDLVQGSGGIPLAAEGAREEWWCADYVFRPHRG